MSVQLDMTDSKKSRIIKDGDNVKIFNKDRMLYDGPYKDVHIIGVSDRCISFGFPGKVFRLDFYMLTKQEYLQLTEVFSEKIRERKEADLRYAIKAKKEREERKQKNKEIFQQSKVQCQQALQELQQISLYNKLAKCPRCKSTSISYDTKKLSLGRALVGDMIAGAPGAILGGLSSKKGYAVCLKCGKRWKI